MSEEEIKVFAKQCVMLWNHIVDYGLEDLDEYQTVVAALHLLQNNYCIVPKSEVVKLYKRVLTDDYIVTSSDHRLQMSRGIRFALRKIFGSELLTRKENDNERL